MAVSWHCAVSVRNIVYEIYEKGYGRNPVKLGCRFYRDDGAGAGSDCSGNFPAYQISHCLHRVLCGCSCLRRIGNHIRPEADRPDDGIMGKEIAEDAFDCVVRTCAGSDAGIRLCVLYP